MDAIRSSSERTSPDRNDRWLRIALLLWVILAVAASVKAYTKPGRRSTYLYYSQAAQHWWADENLYAHYEGLDPYRYSPTFAVAATPFGLMPDRWGGVVWVLGSTALLVWSLRVAVREVLPGRWSPNREAMFLTLSLIPSLSGLWSAQSNALILAVILLGMAALGRAKWWQAAWLLAIPVFIKIWPLAVVLMLIMRWGQPLMRRFGVACVGLAAVPFLTRSWSIVWRQYHDYYLSLVGPMQGRWPGYRDAWMIWEHLHAPVDPRVYSVLQAISLAAVIAWCYWQAHRLPRDKQFLAAVLSIWSAWQLFLGPGSERLTYGLIAPAVAWAVLISFQNRRGRALSCCAWLLVAVLSMGDFERALGRLVPHAQILLPAGVLVMIVWILVYFAQPAELPARGAPIHCKSFLTVD